MLSEGLGAAFQKGKGGCGRGVRAGTREAAFQDWGADREAGFSGKNPDSPACEPCRAGRKKSSTTERSGAVRVAGVSRSSLHYRRVEEPAEGRRLLRVLDETTTKDPCIGSRRLAEVLERDYGIRKRIQRLRPKMRIETSWCRPRRTSMADNGHRKYPHLLRDRLVEFGDEVWCSDIYLALLALRAACLQAISALLRFVYPDAAGARLPVCSDGLAQPQAAWLGGEQHDGLGADGKSPGGRGGAMRRPSANLQHRPRQPVHLAGMDGKAQRVGDRREYGRQGAVDGQRVH